MFTVYFALSTITVFFLLLVVVFVRLLWVDCEAVEIDLQYVEAPVARANILIISHERDQLSALSKKHLET